MTRAAIERELQWCMAELKVAMNTRPLRSRADGWAAPKGFPSLYRRGVPKETILYEAQRFIGCQEAPFTREHKTYTFNGREYELIIHYTVNKKKNTKACSVSIFDGRTFLAYLFSTNDPLAFDNFNRFRHGGAASLPCVEQLAFCKGKTRLNKHIAKNLDPEEFKKQALAQFDRPGYGGDVWKKYVYPGEWGSMSGDEIKASLAAANASRLQTDYIAWLRTNLTLPATTDSGDFKKVGRNLLNLRAANGQTFIDTWDHLSLPCVLFARMAALRVSPTESMLASTMMAKCVVECSNDDNLWGYALNPKDVKDGDSLHDLTLEDKGIQKLFAIADDALVHQKAIIKLMASADDKALFDILTNANSALLQGHKTTLNDRPASIHRLGLSERILQALWRGRIVFSEPLVHRLFAFLAFHGLKEGDDYAFYIPDSLAPVEGLDAYDVATAIGRPL